MVRSIIKQRVAALLGDRRWRQVKVLRDKIIADPRLRRQRMIDVEIGAVTIKVPERHPVVRFKAEQPYRNMPIGITAEAVAKKYPDASFVDIGANIGDTAAMMASYAPNPLILVEPSDFYHQILTDNARKLPNVRRIEFVFVSTDDSPVRGRLRHWGGTATFEDDGQQMVGVTKRLSQVADSDSRFVKMDTDGLDFAIIRSSIEWLSDTHPLLLFESDVSTDSLHTEARETFDALIAAGYHWFVLWDDRGYHIATTDDPRVIRTLHSWLHRRRTAHFASDAVSNFDVLCAAPSDREIVEAVTSASMAMP